MTKYIHNTQEISYKGSVDPVVSHLIKIFNPQSVIDIGCGYGKWLEEFYNCGVTDILGIDGDYIDKEKLTIPIENFKDFDLERPIIIDKKYDLLLCLEVAEHLTPERAKSLIYDLIKLSDTIVFSAAIPFQPGKGHINGQYPQFWLKLFEENNFNCYDIIRPIYWNNNQVEWWYRQNILVFINNKCSVSFKETKAVNPLISAELYEYHIETIKQLENKIINLKLIKRYLKKIFIKTKTLIMKPFISLL